MRRRRAARKAGHGQIEAAPPEMHRAGLAGESRRGSARTPARSLPAHRAAARRLSGRSRAALIVGERHRVGDLVGPAVEARRQAVARRASRPAGDAARRCLPALSGSSSRAPSLTHSTIAWRHRSSARVKVRPSPAAVGRVASPSAVGCSVDVPAVVDPRRMRDADLAEHLRREVKHRQRRHGPARGRARPARLMAHRIARGFAFCARSTAKAAAPWPTWTSIKSDRRAADLAALEAAARRGARQVGQRHRAAEVAGRDGPGDARRRRARRSTRCAKRSPTAIADAQGGARSRRARPAAGDRDASTCRCPRPRRRRDRSIRSAR